MTCPPRSSGLWLIGERAGGEIIIAVVSEVLAVVVLRDSDGDGAASAVHALTDAVFGSLALYGSHFSNTLSNGDVTTGAIIMSAADASSSGSSHGLDGTTTDGDIATSALESAADASSMRSSRGLDGTTTDGDVTTGAMVSASDASSPVSSRGREASIAFDGERRASWACLDGGIS